MLVLLRYEDTREVNFEILLGATNNCKYCEVQLNLSATAVFKMRCSKVASQMKKLVDFTDLKITGIKAYQVDLPLHEGWAL